jgi:hypothetical protein
VGTRKIWRLAKKVNVSRLLSVSLEEVEELNKQALDDYAAFKPNASIYHYKYLLARKDDTTQPEVNRRAIERLLTKEQARKTSWDLRRIKKTPRLGAISKVKVVGSDGSKVTYEGQEEVQKAIMEAIEARYHLSHGSPFLREPLLSAVGLTGTSVAAQQILDGTFRCPEGTDKTTRLLIGAQFLSALTNELVKLAG